MKKWMINHLKLSWHRSLSLLWLLIIAHQWLSYTEPVWLIQTTTSVWIVLIAVSIIEIIVPVKLQYRLMLEAVAIFCIIYYTINHYGLYVPDPWASSWLDRVQDISIHMMPYIWFGLGAWVLLVLSVRMIISKGLILFFIGMNIVAFAALDSFTISVLWKEVAWTVFAGMGWLVSQHLRSFQLYYPRGWAYMLDYPYKIIVNIAIVFSLVIIIGVNMPGIRPVLTDPYTAWHQWNGNGKPSGFGTGSKQDGRDKTSATNHNPSSGYGVDDENLGGGFKYDFTPVMTVVSDLRTYLRGETRSVYSGTGWSDDTSATRGPFEEVEVGQSLANNEASKVTTRTLKQTFKILNKNDFPVVFGAYSVATVDSLDGEKTGNGLSWRQGDREVLWDVEGKGQVYPVTIELTSEIPIIPVQELSAKTYGELYNGNDMDEMFLQLPDHFPERVKVLAEEITAAGRTPYEKTALLQQYLQQTFPYTNQPDVTRRTSADLVDSFLFEVKEGYCDYYSTALVTMARSLNIPARWVKGYAPGEQAELPDNLSFQQRSAINSNYTITNADAHSWAEVYFGDYGWIPVEATPGFNVPLLVQNERESEIEPRDEVEQELESEQRGDTNASGEQGFQVGHWGVLAAVVILLAWLLFIGWNQRLNLRFLVERLLNGRSLSPDQKVIAETGRWVRYLRHMGMMKEEHETLREAVGHWSQEHPEIAENLTSLLRMFEQAKYSPDVIEDKGWHSVYTEALRLRRNMKARK